MLHRAYATFSTAEAGNLQYDKLRSSFSRLDRVPRVLRDSIISNFLHNVSEQVVGEKTESNCKIRNSLPFKDQVAANAGSQAISWPWS